MGEFWIFGYGSLIWRPGFPHIETVRARLHGYRRSLCIYSHHYRGTEANPGLVLGLEKGGSCFGLAFRVAADQADETLDYLRKRELVTQVYLEKWLRLKLDDGRRVEAVTYVADQHHTQFAGTLSAEAAATIVASATGVAGPNIDYVESTVSHLRQMGVHDPMLEHIGALASATPQA